jgi:hypothetical protein
MDHGNILVVQSYGYIENKDDHSPGAEGSRKRINQAARLVLDGIIPDNDLIAVFPQGYSKKHPTSKPGLELRPSLGAQMAAAMIEYRVFQTIKIVFEDLGWGTMWDIFNTYKMVEEMGFKTGTMHFVSDPTHLRRVKLVWNAYHPNGWYARFYPTPEEVLPFWERLLKEPVKRAWYRLVLWWKL